MSTWTMAQQRLYRRQVEQLNRATNGHYGDDDRRALMARVTGKASTADLDREGMAHVIDEQDRLLRQWGAAEERPRRASAFRHRTISQDEYLATLVRQLGWDEARLRGFISRQFNGWRSAVGQLDRRQRSGLITALKGLLQSQARGTAATERPEGQRGHGRTGGAL
jgi:hypothetical protein